MFSKQVSEYRPTAADQQLAREVAAAERVRYDASPHVSAEEIIEAASFPDRVVEVNGNTLRYDVKEPARSLQIGAADPVGHVVNEAVAQINRRADHAREQIAQLTDPATGQPRKGFDREHRVAVMQLRDLQMAAAYEQTVTADAMRARVASEQAGVRTELQDELDAQVDAYVEADEGRWSRRFNVQRFG